MECFHWPKISTFRNLDHRSFFSLPTNVFYILWHFVPSMLFFFNSLCFGAGTEKSKLVGITDWKLLTDFGNEKKSLPFRYYLHQWTPWYHNLVSNSPKSDLNWAYMPGRRENEGCNSQKSKKISTPAVPNQEHKKKETLYWWTFEVSVCKIKNKDLPPPPSLLDIKIVSPDILGRF